MSYTCPRCGRTSHNPNDARERYCGNCHKYEGPVHAFPENGVTPCCGRTPYEVRDDDMTRIPALVTCMR